MAKAPVSLLGDFVAGKHYFFEGPTSSRTHTPIVYVHGACVGAWCWKEGFLSQSAKRGFPSFALNLPGHGELAPDPHLGTYGIHEYSDYVTRFLDALRSAYPKPPFLVGHSMGGITVQKTAMYTALSGLVLIASAPPRGIRFVRWDNMLPVSGGELARAVWSAMRGKPVLPSKELITATFGRIARSPDEVDRLYAKFTPESPRIGSEIVRGHIAVDPLTIHAPVLVIGGGCDNVIHPDIAFDLAEFYAVEPVIFPDLSHVLIFEPGWKEVSNTMLDWMLKHEVS